MEIKVAIYVRISADVAGEGLGVTRQEEDCRSLADGRGWKVAEVYVDNDISAFSGKARPAYLAMLDAVEAKKVQAVIAWHPDRLHRSPRELETFIDLVERTRCKVATVRAGDYDLTSPTGRMSARIVGAVARGESEHKSDRIRRKLAQNADAGKHHGGSRPYGWEDDRITLRPAEAAMVRFAAERLISGASVKSIVRDLTAKGATNSVGRPWRDVTVRSMLLRERNAGLRLHHGKVHGKGAWQPILTESEMDSVRRILTNPQRRTTPGALGRTRLLSGIASCGVCGSVMRASQGKPYKGVSKPIYRCHGPGQCISRDMAYVDEYVVAVVCERLSHKDAARLMLSPDGDPHSEARQEAARLRQRLVDAATDHANDLLTREQLAAVTAALRPRIEALDAVATPPPPPIGALAELVTSEDVRATWDLLDIRQQREIVALLLSVSINPTRPGPGFDPASLTVAPYPANR